MKRLDNPYRTKPNRFKHKSREVTSLLHDRRVEELRDVLSGDYDFEVGYVPKGYEHRPDKISNIFYGTPDNWWLLLMANGISNPLEGFKINQKIKIPRL